MFTQLTKEQVASLPEDQQEVVARLVLDENKQHRALLAKARDYRGTRLVPAVLWIAGCAFWMWKKDLMIALPVFTLALWFVVHFHVAGVNRRLDAVLQLLDDARKAGENPTNKPTRASGGEDAQDSP